MEIKRRFEPDHNLVVFEVSGPVDLGRFLGAATDVVSHPEFVPGMNSLWNLLEADAKHLSRSDFQMHEVAFRSVQHERGKAMVIFVVPDRLTHGIVRMYMAQAGRDHLDYQVVHSLPEAYTLLGLPG